MKQRPILVATIGYIIGILGGLYFTISIVPFYMFLLATYFILHLFFRSEGNPKFKLLSFRRYSRYVKLWFDPKTIGILCIFSILSNTVVLYQQNQYKNSYQDGENIQLTGIIVSQKIEKQYYNLYQVKIEKKGNFKVYIQVDKRQKDFEYGDQIQCEGNYEKPNSQRNYGGYDESQYFKTIQMIGTVKVKEINVLKKKQLNLILQKANDMSLKIKQMIDTYFEQEEGSILKGILLGETTEIEENVKENFQITNISHILAISGMHIGYIILGVQLLTKKRLGKQKTKIVTIFTLVGYIFLTGFSPSIVRAVVMGIIMLGEGLLHRKSDVWNSIALSLLGMLCYNPFLLLNVGLQLSYLSVIGILFIKPVLSQIFEPSKLKKEASKIIKELKGRIVVTLSVQTFLLPIMLYHFNHFGIYFLLTNLLVSMIIGPILIGGFFSIFLSFISPSIAKGVCFLESIGIQGLKQIGEISQFPFSKVYFSTPSWIFIILYFLFILIGKQIYFLYASGRSLTATQKRFRNLISLFQYRFSQKKKKYMVSILIFVLLFSLICVVPKDLKIYFVDVGQGDCTFIVTPRNQKVLMDGGGSLSENFDVGEKIVAPYLLDRGCTTIDYVMISHFDQDHVRFYPIFITRNKSEKCHNRKAV